MPLTPAEQFLHDLVAIPSVTSDRAANDQALDYIGAYLQKQGMHVARHDYVETLEAAGKSKPQKYGTLVATTTPTKTPEVMLSAHVDVVPAPDELFQVRQKDGKLLGRGTIDMKSSIAAYLELVRNLKNDLTQYDFGITIITNEEIGGHGVQNLLDEGYLPKAVVLPDSGTDWNVESASKGAWTVQLTAPGIAAHGSRPWNGDSASLKLLDTLAEIRTLFPRQGVDTNTLNISQLSGGTAQNVVPAAAAATLDIRVVNQHSLDDLRKRVIDICTRHGVKHKIIGFFPPLEHDMSNAYIQSFRASIQEVTGVTPGEVISCGSCDASYYDKRGIPTIVTRPPGGNAHATDEWIDKQGFLQLPAVLEHFIKKTCKIV